MKHTEHHRFTWTSGHLTLEIEIAYTPNLHIFDHLGIHAVKPAKAQLPISETGYRSHYVPAGTVAAAGGPAQAVQIILDEAATSSKWQEYLESQRQGSLF